MNIFITGGCGFIGSHIVEYHLAKKDKVFAVDNLTTGSIDNIKNFIKNPHFKFVEADIVNWSNLDDAVAESDRIYHMSAVVGNLRVIMEPVNVIASNIAGCERLFSSIIKSKKLPRIILASSSCVYGNTEHTSMKEEDDLIVEDPSHLHSNYSISKLCDEIIGLSYDHVKNIPTTIIRFFNTIGTRQTGSYGFVVPRFVEQACLNQPLTVYGDGKQTRSFCDVHDVVNILDILANNTSTRSQIINVGNDREVTILELAKIVRKRADSSSEIRYIPYKEVYGEEFIDVMHRKPDLTKCYKLSNYKHQWTLEDTIDKLIHEFREKGSLFTVKKAI